jgi:hypothetical protein
MIQSYKGVSNLIYIPQINYLKQGVVLSPWFFNFALVYGIRSVLVNQGGLKLIGTHMFVFDADDVNILGGNIHTIKKNTYALAVASKETRLRVNADKSKYRVTS